MSMKELQDRYARAIDRLIELTAEDPTLIGLYIYGSSIRGDFWEHSDIDAVFISSDESRPWQVFSLVEEGIHVDAEVCSRNHFRRIHEENLRGSVAHTIFSSGKLLYCEDPALQEYLVEAKQVGQRDLELLRMRTAMNLGGSLHLANKALAFRADPVSGFRWMVLSVEDRSRLTILAHGEPLCRDVVARASQLEAGIDKLWQSVLEAHSDVPELLKIHATMTDALREDAETLFKPLLDYLREERVVRTASDIQRAVGERAGIHSIGMLCHKLAAQGLIQQTTMPVRLTRKGRVDFEETAFFYGGEA